MWWDAILLHTEYENVISHHQRTCIETVQQAKKVESHAYDCDEGYCTVLLYRTMLLKMLFKRTG